MNECQAIDCCGTNNNCNPIITIKITNNNDKNNDKNNNKQCQKISLFSIILNVQRGSK